MALRWNLSNIDDFSNLCFRQHPDDPEADQMEPVTQGLIWACMAVGIGEINEDTVDEFYARVSIWEDIHGSYVSMSDSDGPPKPRPITPEDVRKHMGLSVNVSYEDRDEWLGRVVKRRLDDRAARSRKDREQAREKAGV